MMLPLEFRARREALGLSQGLAADVLGVQQVTVSRWETGARPIPDGVADDLADLEGHVAALAKVWDGTWPAGNDAAAVLARVAAARADAALRMSAVVPDLTTGGGLA